MIVISFVNMKGGVEKTTLAVNVADFLAKRHSKKVLLVDMDPQFNATQCLMSSENYIEYLSHGGTTVVDVFKNVNIANVSVVGGVSSSVECPYENIRPYTTDRSFDLIPGQLDLFRFEMAPGQGTELRLKNYLNHIRKNDAYDICIIDCPPTPSVWMTSAIIASDYYLIPSKPDPISMTGLDLLDSIIRERKENYGCTCKCLGLVLTMVETNTTIYHDTRKYFSSTGKWKQYLYRCDVLKRTSVAKGQLNGTFISDIDDNKLNFQFSGVVQEFLKRLGMQ